MIAPGSRVLVVKGGKVKDEGVVIRYVFETDKYLLKTFHTEVFVSAHQVVEL